jgi:hypothetical protein
MAMVNLRCKCFCSRDISALAGFVPAAEKHDDYRASPGKIEPVSRTIVYAKFTNAIAHRLGIAKVAESKTIEASSNARLSSDVSKTINPRQEYGSLANLDHL